MVMGGVGGRVSCEVCECWGFIMGKFQGQVYVFRVFEVFSVEVFGVGVIIFRMLVICIIVMLGFFQDGVFVLVGCVVFLVVWEDFLGVGFEGEFVVGYVVGYFQLVYVGDFVVG